MLFVNLLLIIIAILAYGHRQARIAASTSDDADINAISNESLSPLQIKNVEALVRAWAPLVWLAPGETFFPVSVPEFLEHVNVANATSSLETDLPEGPQSRNAFLVTISDVDELLSNTSSILYGRNPESDVSVPVYAQVRLCSTESGSFHVSYWLFFPYNEGKKMCTLNMGFLGPWPIPMLRSRCVGTIKQFGSHVGDWEHISLNFEVGSSIPTSMYVSTHDAGAYYKYDASQRMFLFTRQEVRKGIMQRPIFPPQARLTPKGSHPILFAAKGSHGLWTAPGKHKFVRLPRLYDFTGYGAQWETWRSVEILYSTHTMPNWQHYWGRWGNPRSMCHPFAKLGLNICQLSDGPTGIPLKKQNFKCRKMLNYERSNQVSVYS